MWSDSLLTLKAKSRDRHDFTSQTLPPILDNASLQRATASLTISKSSIHELIRFEFCTYTVWHKSLVEIRFY